jgi:hypothetical protein
MHPLERSVTDAIAAGRDELVGFAADLVPSTLRRESRPNRGGRRPPCSERCWQDWAPGLRAVEI